MVEHDEDWNYSVRCENYSSKRHGLEVVPKRCLREQIRYAILNAKADGLVDARRQPPDGLHLWVHMDHFQIWR